MAWVQLAAAQSSSAVTEYSLTIHSGPLATALIQFSKQTGLQVGAKLETLEEQQHLVDAVIGRYTADAALERLLAGTGLKYVWEGGTTIRIYAVVAPHGVGDVHEIVVTGSRIGGGEGPAPVRVYDRADIDRYGVSSLPALAGYFPQQTFSFGEWAQRSGAQHFQMRGLGVDTTLVLINGRRAPPSATSVTLNAFDLNTIPITAVDRIEVMSDSASAIYGADAIGGVVNIILKEGTSTPEIYIHYGAADGGADERRFAGTVGTTGPFKSSLTVDYFERDMLVGTERDLWRDQDFRRFGGRDYRVTMANPGNVYSVTPGALLPGLSTPQASVPAGAGDVRLTPQDFLATAGVVSSASALTTRSIIPDTRRLSVAGSAEFSLNDHLSVFGEMLATNSDVIADGTLPFLFRGIVPAGNPYNPFGQPVAVDYSLAGMDVIKTSVDSELKRFVLGARGVVSRWHWEIVLTNTKESVESTRYNDVDSAKVQAALASTDPDTALNPFTDGPAGSQALLSSLVGAPQELDFFSGGEQLSGFVKRELLSLPGGMSEVVLGGEWRREELRFFDTAAVERHRDIKSGFTEIKLPVWDRLTLKLALRGDYYEKADDAVNPQYGLVWTPSQNWVFRAAYGTSFRPPSLVELSSQRSHVVLIIPDPLRGGTASPVDVTTGGNPELDNVSAHSFTAGFIFKPNYWPGLKFGAHYWRVEMDNRIVVPRTVDVEKLQELGRATRDDPSDAERLAGWRGPLRSLDVSLLNFGRLDTSGVDLDLSYWTTVGSGRLETALAATWVHDYSAHDLSSVLPLNRVGIANVLGTIPRWRLVGSLNWEARGWGSSATATFTPEYWDSDLSGVMNRRLSSRTIVDLQAWVDLDRLAEGGLFDGLKLTAGVLNLFDRDVDFANVGLTAGFDISQADLRQRFGYFRISKDF